MCSNGKVESNNICQNSYELLQALQAFVRVRISANKGSNNELKKSFKLSTTEQVVRFVVHFYFLVFIVLALIFTR